MFRHGCQYHFLLITFILGNSRILTKCHDFYPLIDCKHTLKSTRKNANSILKICLQICESKHLNMLKGCVPPILKGRISGVVWMPLLVVAVTYSRSLYSLITVDITVVQRDLQSQHDNDNVDGMVQMQSANANSFCQHYYDGSGGGYGLVHAGSRE